MARIAYVILTCEKYWNTRVVWQKRTSFARKNVDLFYLGHMMNPEKRLFSWGAADDYNSLPHKLYDGIKYMDLASAYDYIMILDDDTYVYHDKLLEYLKGYDPKESLAIGRLLDHIAHTEYGMYLSGGAGMVITSALYQQLHEMLNQKRMEESITHWCADICLGQWIKSLKNHAFVNCLRFHTDLVPFTNDAITYHHLKTEEDYYQLSGQKVE
jgi:hypothetical protein